MIRNSSGFTLIEVLVVMFIISIISSVLILNIDISRVRSHTVEDVAYQTLLTIQYLQEQAILRPAILGISLRSGGYELSHYVVVGQQGEWHALDSERILKMQILPEDIDISIKSVDENIFTGDGEFSPDIIIFPSGEFTHFELTIAAQGELPQYRIVGTAAGEVRLNPL